MVYQTVGQPVAGHPDSPTLIDVVDSRDQDWQPEDQSERPRHEVGVHHMAVNHVGPPTLDQLDQPKQTARIGYSAPHLQGFHGESEAPRLESHGSQWSEGDDEELVAMGAHGLRRRQEQLVRSTHPHTGRKEEDPHTSLSRVRMTPRRTIRFKLGGM
jgi:hypothetical protein